MEEYTKSALGGPDLRGLANQSRQILYHLSHHQERELVPLAGKTSTGERRRFSQLAPCLYCWGFISTSPSLIFHAREERIPSLEPPFGKKRKEPTCLYFKGLEICFNLPL
ncbi:hypothetical protein CapIbe_001577 [Capra ibex]